MPEVVDVGLRLPVPEHPVVHRRAKHHGRPRREKRGREEIVGASLGGPGEEVGGGRRDTDHIRLVSEPDMECRALGGEHLSEGRPAGHALEGEGLDELACPAGQ